MATLYTQKADGDTKTFILKKIPTIKLTSPGSFVANSTYKAIFGLHEQQYTDTANVGDYPRLALFFNVRCLSISESSIKLKLYAVPYWHNAKKYHVKFLCSIFKNPTSTKITSVDDFLKVGTSLKDVSGQLFNENTFALESCTLKDPVGTYYASNLLDSYDVSSSKKFNISDYASSENSCITQTVDIPLDSSINELYLRWKMGSWSAESGISRPVILGWACKDTNWDKEAASSASSPCSPNTDTSANLQESAQESFGITYSSAAYYDSFCLIARLIVPKKGDGIYFYSANNVKKYISSGNIYYYTANNTKTNKLEIYYYPTSNNPVLVYKNS